MNGRWWTLAELPARGIYRCDTGDYARFVKLPGKWISKYYSNLELALEDSWDTSTYGWHHFPVTESDDGEIYLEFVTDDSDEIQM